MASSARSISQQVYNICALIAQVFFQRENASYTSSPHTRAKHDQFLYSNWHDIVERAWGRRWEYQSSEAQHSDQRKHRCISSADEWFEKLEAKTLTLFRKGQKETRAMTGAYPKVVRIAILDVGIDPKCSFRGRVKTDKSFLEGENGRDYWKDETGHSTAVAYQVARVCPNVEIYIARIAERTDAVASEEWKVDIVNMSFGWELQDDEDGVEEALIKTGNLGRILLLA
ncbi:hypothetical protein G6011_09899 [Alternaria panax]|uniref:Peptidase S8/S53 domain-containing protein n=1 Tax=Alternaria panax TaxID=48097 RepID=A0AAD4I7N2_9PLEO|nr:hypothetical protein G6011_09899 [Alternaria panax]